MATATGKGRAAARFPVYQIDFTAVASGKYIATSKRRIRWRFGFSNKEALERGETGTGCRGEEHDITCVWSVTSGKRLILADGREVHYSNNRGSVFDFSWTMRGNHVLKVVMHAAPALSGTPGFRQYDLLVDGQSFFNMPKVYELGIRGKIPAHAPVPGVITRGERPPPSTGTYDLNRGEYVNAPQTRAQEEADLQAAIKASLEESKAHLSKPRQGPVATTPALPPAAPAPAPAPSAPPERGALYRDASEFRLVSKEAQDAEADLLDLLGDWSGQDDPTSAPPPPPAQSPFMTPPAPAPAQASYSGFDNYAAPAPSYTQQPPAAYNQPPNTYTQPSGFGHAADDPFAPKPIQDVTPVQQSFNQMSLNIMSQYGQAETTPTTNPVEASPDGVPTEANNPTTATQTQSMSAPFDMSEPEPSKPKTAVDSAMSKLVNFDDLNAPAETEIKLSMNSNPFAEQEKKTQVVQGKVKSMGIPPTASNWAGPQPSLSEMKSLKPQTAPKEGSSVMKQAPQAMVVSAQQNGNYGGYAAQQGYGQYGYPQQQQPMQQQGYGQMGGYQQQQQPGMYQQQQQQPPQGYQYQQQPQQGYPPNQQYGY